MTTMGETSRAVALGLGVGLLAACGEPEPPEVEATHPQVRAYLEDPAALARGEALFRGSCGAYCHALDPAPDDPAANLFDCHWEHGSSAEEITGVIVNGLSGTSMVGYGSHFPDGDNDILKIIAFLRQHQQQDC